MIIITNNIASLVIAKFPASLQLHNRTLNKIHPYYNLTFFYVKMQNYFLSLVLKNTSIFIHSFIPPIKNKS